jgi:hypothetical protein
MAILRQRKLTGTPPVLLETPGKMYIEGHAHDTNTLAILSNDVMPIPAANAISAMSSGSRRWQTAASYSAGSVHAGFEPLDSSLLDCGSGVGRCIYELTNFPNDAVVLPGTYTVASTLSWYGIRKDSAGKYVLNASAVATAASNSSIAGIGVFDDPTGQVYSVIFEGAAATNTTGQIRRLPVSGGSATTLISSGTATMPAIMQFVYDDGTHLWFLGKFAMASAGQSQTYGIYTLNKTALTFASRGGNNRTASAGGPGYYSSYGIPTSGTTFANYTGVYGGATAGSTATGAGMIKFEVSVTDTNTFASTYTFVTPTGDSAIPGQTIGSVGFQYRTWHKIAGSTVYLFVSLYVPSTGPAAAARQYIYTYKTTTANPTAIEYVTATQVSSAIRPRGVMPTNAAADALVIPYSEQVEYWTWSAVQETYVKQATIGAPPSVVQIDDLGRLWIVDTSGVVHLNSPTTSSDVIVTFQNPSLTYTGTTINTNLVVNSYNFAGERIASNVTLQLDTNSASFSGGVTTTSITTSTSADTLVPVAITGAGYIRVIANLVI